MNRTLTTTAALIIGATLTLATQHTWRRITTALLSRGDT